jgi:ethanolamine utilization protein EutQ
MKRRFLTADVIRARKAQGFDYITLEAGDVLTQLAQDTAREMGIKVCTASPVEAALLPPAQTSGANGNGQAVTSPALVEVSTAPMAPPGLELEPLIRQVVMACLTKINGSSAAPQAPVKRVNGQTVQMQPFPFEINRPEMDVQLVDVITAQHGSPIAAGFLSFHKGSFPWTLTYDEIEFVLEGEIHIGTAQGTVVGKPGDVLYIPKGTQITFGTPGWAKILYVTYPAEWAG